MIEQLSLFSTPSTPPEDAATPSASLPPTEARPRLTVSAHLQSAITAWREQMAKDDVSPNTIKAFGGDLNLFAQFTGVGKEVGQLTTRELNEWLTWQRNTKKCSPKTYARRVTSLKSFFRWLHQTHVLVKDPAAALIQQSVLSPLPEYLTPVEVEQALIAAHALRHADKPDMRPEVLFTLLLQTGLKKSECLTLKPDDVDGSNPDEPVLWVRYEKTEHRYKERKLKLAPEWLATYREYLAQYEPRDVLFPWSPRRLEYLLEDVTKVGGLSKHISFEMCRWTFAMREARAGVDYNHIRQKLGLSKIQWREIGMKLERLIEGEGEP